MSVLFAFYHKGSLQIKSEFSPNIQSWWPSRASERAPCEFNICPLKFQDQVKELLRGMRENNILPDEKEIFIFWQKADRRQCVSVQTCAGCTGWPLWAWPEICSSFFRDGNDQPLWVVHCQVSWFAGIDIRLEMQSQQNYAIEGHSTSNTEWGSIFLVSQCVSQSFWHCQNLLIVTVSKSLWHSLWHQKYGT